MQSCVKVCLDNNRKLNWTLWNLDQVWLVYIVRTILQNVSPSHEDHG